MEINFFTVWFFISPFIILYLYLKNKEYKEKAETVVEQINDVWDNDYKKLIQSYGTLDNFLEAHKKDFDIIRSNMVTIYANISEINRDYMVKTERLLSMIENNRITKEEIYKAVKMVRKDICMNTDDLLTRFNSFIFSEEKAHSDNTKISDILDDIDEKYKNNEIYQEVNKD